MTIDNIFDIQSEITRQIVLAVKGEMSTSDQQLLGEKPTNNLQAWEAFLHARAATLRADYGRDKYIEAQPWAQRAVTLDPEFADAWAILTEIHGQAFWIGYDNSEQRIADAKAALDKAVALKPDSAAVKAAQADFLYRFENKYPDALAMYKQAHLLAPGDARILLYVAITQRRLGLWDESIETFEKARELDPANLFVVTQVVDTLGLMNEWQRVDDLAGEWVIRYPESRDLRASQISAKMHLDGNIKLARELFDLMPAWTSNTYFRVANALARWERDYDAWLEILDKPEIADYRAFNGAQSRLLSKGIAFHFKGEQETARHYFLQLINDSVPGSSPNPRDNALTLTLMSSAYIFLGETDNALAASRKASEILPQEKDHIFGANYAKNHTWVLAMAGQREEALDRIAASIDAPEGFSRWELQLDPLWDFFRDDQRFVALASPEGVNQ
jgi:serine/threonine-protein kinase